MAKALGIGQEGVSRIEQRSDLLENFLRVSSPPPPPLLITSFTH